MNNQHSDYISRTRAAVTRLLGALDELRALDKQRIATDVVNQLTPADFAGGNDHLTVSDIASVTTTLGALEAVLDQGHGTNLYRVKL